MLDDKELEAGNVLGRHPVLDCLAVEGRGRLPGTIRLALKVASIELRQLHNQLVHDMGGFEEPALVTIGFIPEGGEGKGEKRRFRKIDGVLKSHPSINAKECAAAGTSLPHGG